MENQISGSAQTTDPLVLEIRDMARKMGLEVFDGIPPKEWFDQKRQQRAVEKEKSRNESEKRCQQKWSEFKRRLQEAMRGKNENKESKTED